MMGPFKRHRLLSLALLVALVSAAELAADTPPPDVRDRYIHFLNQHRDNSNVNTGGRYCNDMMKKRGMTSPKCKEKNSFIHASDTAIKAVCDKDGEDYGTLRRSCNQFRVTTCNLKGGSTRPPCDYRHDNRPRYIVIACDKGFPVHYDEGKVIVDPNWPCKK